MLDHPRQFFATIIGQPSQTGQLPSEVIPRGASLGPTWREGIAYRLAELGFVLKSQVPIIALPQSYRLPVGKFALSTVGILVDRRSVLDTSTARYDEDALLYDLPHALISRPFCEVHGTDVLATEIAADFLSLSSLSRMDVLSRWFAVEEAETIVDALQRSTPSQLMTALAWCYGVESAGTVASALEIADAARATSKSTKPHPDTWDPLESTCRHASLSIL